MNKDKIKGKEGFVEVTATTLGVTKTKTTKIKVRPFVTNPAEVEVEFGTWIPTGDYAGVRAGVRVMIPCYREEIPKVYDLVSKFVDKVLEKEVDRLTEGMDENE